MRLTCAVVALLVVCGCNRPDAPQTEARESGRKTATLVAPLAGDAMLQPFA
jgi:hypothetical protein